ncbi:MAG: glucan biosynthesis protein, partial [Gemmataceae bacterium]
LLHRESWTVRYLSDSAYWLYLVHLPPIYCMQALVRDGSLSPLLKFAIVCAGSTGVLLISYQLLVRHTYLGVLLNGHRERLDPKKGTF